MVKRNLFRNKAVTGLLLLGSVCHGELNPASFVEPSDSARPMTWMHMMNGNASKAGLSKDLKALSDAGVGGALIFSIQRNTGKGNMPDWYINNEPLPEGPRSTFTTHNFYSRDHTLLPSGLLGPVILTQEAVLSITKK